MMGAKTYGNVLYRTCDNCGNPNWWMYQKIWDTLKFSRINVRHYLTCSICDRGFKLHAPYFGLGKNDISPVKELIRLSKQRFEQESISDDEYRAVIESNPIWQLDGDHPPVGTGKLAEKRLGLDGRVYAWTGSEWLGYRRGDPRGRVR